MIESNLDFEIMEFSDSMLDDNNLTDKIQTLNEIEEEDDDSDLVNPDLVDESNLDELDLTEEEKKAILKKKEEKAKKTEESEEESEVKEEEEETEEDDTEESPLKIFAQELAEKNLLDIPEDWEGDEESLYDAYEKTLEDRAVSMVKNAYKIDDPKVDGVLNFLKNGGNIDDYINLHADTNWVDVDIEDEDNATALVKTYLQSVKGLEEEEAEELVEGYKEKNKLFNQASKIQSDLQKYREKQEEELIKSQEEYARYQREEYSKTVNKIRETIKIGKSDNVVIAKNQKTNLEDFIFSPMDIKDNKGQIVGRSTGFKKVLNEYLSDPEKMVALAYKLYEGLSDKSEKVEIESKVRSKLADSIKKTAGKKKESNDFKIEFIN
jgi:hypothetical protein